LSKIVDREELQELISRFQGEGKTIVFTNGCFDLLHVGHVRYLQEAKDLGDLLVVGLNSDSSVARLKGKNRPLIPQGERAEILSALECVDFITVFEEDTPEKLILILRPDWVVKGGDYKLGDLPEAKLVEQFGGKIKTLSFVPNHSTSQIIEKAGSHADHSKRQ